MLWFGRGDIHYYHYLNFQNNINFKIRCVWVYIFTFIYIQFHSAEIMSSKHFLYGQSAVQIKVNTLFQSRLNTVDEWRALCNTTKHKIIVRQQMMLNKCVVILDMSNKKIIYWTKVFSNIIKHKRNLRYATCVGATEY